MSSIAALPTTGPVVVPARRPRLELVGPGYVPPAPPRPARPAQAQAGHAHTRPRPEARTRLTTRGRAVVATIALVAATAGAVAVGTAAGQAGAPAPAEGPVTAVTVEPGQTLWGIAAGAAAPGEDVRDVVAELVALNGLHSGDVRAGQQILVPAA